jgi:DNA-binding response OmpR family regulator
MARSNKILPDSSLQALRVHNQSVVNFNLPIPAMEASLTTQSKRLVYIEDEAEMIDLVRLILGRRGYTVMGANGGREGLELVRKELPDLVLLDLMMPDMDGWDVYHQMKSEEETRNIPVIVITAKALNIDKVLGLRIAKVEDYIAKPFSPQELLQRVDQVLSKDEK